MSIYPLVRMRRIRNNDFSRSIIRENILLPKDLILPLFICEGKNVIEPIKSMIDGVDRISIDVAIKRVKEAHKLGIKMVALFPVIEDKFKNENCSYAYDKNNIMCRTIKSLKDNIPEMGLMLDVALDPFNSLGHDGIVKNGIIENDKTVDILVKQALCYAEAGADVIAPSDMMDGRIGVIREELEENGFTDIIIISYSVKYSSNLYGPFRDAVGSAKNLGSSNKDTYQMDFANSREALREVELDIDEGADMIIIKPASFYLDIIREVKNNFNIPIISYQVSGEYSMLKLAAKNGIFNEEKIFYENLIACKRAGSDAIISYYAMDMARILNKK